MVPMELFRGCSFLFPLSLGSVLLYVEAPVENFFLIIIGFLVFFNRQVVMSGYEVERAGLSQPSDEF